MRSVIRSTDSPSGWTFLPDRPPAQVTCGYCQKVHTVKYGSTYFCAAEVRENDGWAKPRSVYD